MKFEELEPILNRYGWTLECESPLEIRHKDSSFASGVAAKIMINHIVSESLDIYEELQYNLSECIMDFEESQRKVVGCFLFLHNPDVEGTQLLELSHDDYKFVPSNAQIIATDPLQPITRLSIFSSPDEEN